MKRQATDWEKMFAENTLQRAVHLLLLAMQNDITTLEDSLAVSYKAKPSVTTIQSSSCAP